MPATIAFMHGAQMLLFAICAELVLIVTAVLFIVLYTALIHTEQKPELGEAEARFLLPFVAVLVSGPLFYRLSFTGYPKQAATGAMLSLCSDFTL